MSLASGDLGVSLRPYVYFQARGEQMTQNNFTTDFLTVSEVARLMRVSNMTVYRLIRSGSLKAFQVGNRYRVREADVHQYLDDHYVRAV